MLDHDVCFKCYMEQMELKGENLAARISRARYQADCRDCFERGWARGLVVLCPLMPPLWDWPVSDCTSGAHSIGVSARIPRDCKYHLEHLVATGVVDEQETRL